MTRPSRGYGVNSPEQQTPRTGRKWGWRQRIAATLALSVIASILPARNAARLTIREVLAYE